MVWGGTEEQRKEHKADNPNAKDWHDEATKVIEKTMNEMTLRPTTLKP